MLGSRRLTAPAALKALDEPHQTSMSRTRPVPGSRPWRSTGSRRQYSPVSASSTEPTS